MTPAEALREASLSGRFDQFEVSSHAMDQMLERNVTRRDIRCALKTASVAVSEPGERWRVEGGRDDAGDPLTLIVVFDGRTIIVTVF